jgi:adenine-specific DNA-methyltransferase
MECHLKRYRQIMDARRETVRGTIKWFQLHWPRDPRYFESPKVVLPSMFSIPSAAYVPEPAYFGLGSNVIVGDDKNYTLKFICALLNSTLGTWWFVTNGKRRGVGVDVGVDRLRQFPLPQSSGQFSEIEQLVDRILAAKKKHAAADTSALEREIDQRVYRLYGLTPDEIRLVEASGPLSSRRAESAPGSSPEE